MVFVTPEDIEGAKKICQETSVEEGKESALDFDPEKARREFLNAAIAEGLPCIEAGDRLQKRATRSGGGGIVP